MFTDLDRSYVFEGYKIYQLLDNSISPADLDDVEKARMIFQCDLQNDVTYLVNYEYNEQFEGTTSDVKVIGSNEGIQHSFRITTDAFAQGDNRLVNHRTYYFMAIAYGYNQYEEYVYATGSGQDIEYKPSRKGAIGSIRVYSGTPHIPSPEQYGTNQYAAYGDGVVVTRLEGKGNSTNSMDISSESEDIILAEGKIDELVYASHGSPVNIRVVDPLRVPNAEFELVVNASDSDLEDADEVYWTLTNLTDLEAATNEGDSLKSVKTSSKAINVLNEELLLDWGLSITLHQYQYPNGGNFTIPVDATIEFDDPSAPWLLGVPDAEGFDLLNWIRAGTQEGDDEIESEVVFNDIKAGNPLDEDEVYEGILGVLGLLSC